MQWPLKGIEIKSNTMTGPMNKQDFTKVMHYLNTAYNKEFSDGTMRVYYDQLGIYELSAVTNAVREWVSKSEFFPKVADITKLIKDKVVTFEQVMKDLKKVIQVTTGESWNKSQIHSVSYQILNELGGKTSVGNLSDVILEKKVRFKYKYVVNEQLLGIGSKTKKVVGMRSGQTKLLGDLLKKDV